MSNSYAEITNVSTLAQESVPGQYVDKAVMMALVQTLGDRAQVLESLLWQLATESTPDQSATVGAQLDKWGQMVGQPRLGGDYPAGEGDTIYRQKLAAAVLRNRSEGTASDVLGVVAALFGSALTIAVVQDTPPAAFSLLLVVTAPLSTAEQAMVRDFVDRTRGAGIDASIHYSVGAAFGFGSASWIGPWGSTFATTIP